MSDYTVPNGNDGGEALRASNAERDDALNLLSAHFADGRLDRAEFDERAEAALAARTRDQLRALFADLPGPGPIPVPAPEAPAAKMTGAGLRERAGGAIAAAPSPLLFVLVPILLIAAVAAVVHGGPPFPLIPLVFILSRRFRRWNREARPWT
jgi:hypothetical protein